MNVFESLPSDERSTSNLSVVTFVIWTGCLIVGGLGFGLPYTRPAPPRSRPEPVKVEMLEVRLADPPREAEPAANPPPTEPDTLAVPPIPQLIPVAQPPPAIAFALPVEGPVRVVENSRAALVKPPAASAPVPQPLTFGEGEGRQPAPEYPVRSRREGQEGAVTVRFTVAEDGHVIAAEALSPSRWPLLNESALRAVRERWRFSPGRFRVFDVAIRFELTR